MVQATLDSFGTMPRFLTHNLLPISTNIPVATYILHKDAQEFTRLQFDKQTTELAGSLDDLGTTLSSGVRNLSSSLESINDNLEAVRTQLSGISGQLADGFAAVEDAIWNVEIEIRATKQAIVDRLLHLESVLESIDRKLASPEATWSNEQARLAWTSYRVGAYVDSESYINWAIDGHASHTGIKQDQSLRLQRVEVLLTSYSQQRMARVRSDLEDAERYSKIGSDPFLRARWHYDSAQADLVENRNGNSGGLLERAAEHFRFAEQHESFHILARIARARTRFKLGFRDESKALLVDLFSRQPRAFLHISARGEDKFEKDFVRDVLEKSKKKIFDDGAGYRAITNRLSGLVGTAPVLNVTSPSLIDQANRAKPLLKELSQIYDEMSLRSGKLLKQGTFFSAIRYKDVIDFAPRFERKFGVVKQSIENLRKG